MSGGEKRSIPGGERYSSTWSTIEKTVLERGGGWIRREMTVGHGSDAPLLRKQKGTINDSLRLKGEVVNLKL